MAGSAQALQSVELLEVDDREAVAIVTAEREVTWATLEERARRVANALDRAGIGPRRVWALLANNRPEWGELLLGNARAGSRMVPLNWHLTAAELSELLADSGAELLVVDEQLLDVGRSAAATAGVRQTIALGDDYERWLASADDAPLTERPIGTPMMFTGGTTGRSKGVTRADGKGAVGVWSRMYALWGAYVRMPKDGPTLITTPLYHALGQAVFAASLASGKQVVVAHGFDPEETLALIEEHRITSAPMVPTQFIRLLKLDERMRAGPDVSSLEWVLHTAAPCPEWAKRGMIDWFGPVIYELYGSTEGTGPAVCSSEEWLARPGTVGKASARITYSIVDDGGNDLPSGEVGTIYCRSLEGTPAYHGDPEKTAAMVLPDGRFTVGDLGWLDDDGYLYLADRRVDLILVGGSNVYPAEIEAVLVEHPAVADAAVFGIPDPELGEQVKAVLEPTEPASGIDIDDLRSFAADRLASYKLPTSFDLVDALPRQAHGKLKKHLLRDQYWD